MNAAATFPLPEAAGKSGKATRWWQLRWRLGFVALLVGVLPALTWAQGKAGGFDAYLSGLDALSAGRWPEAVTVFSQALEVNGDDPTFVLARGVAGVLAEQFPAGLKDLERAQRLGLKGREAQLWIYTAEAMSGIIVDKDHALGGFIGRDTRAAVVSIPAHVAQGRDDYSSEYGSFIVYRLGMEYQKYRLPPDAGGVGNPTGVKGAAMRQAMLKAGQLFAERWLKRPELAASNLARAKQSFSGQDFGATLREVERALASRPDDPELRLKAAESWLALGRPVTARREFTIALTSRTDLVAGYLGRALAAAQVGDAKRATSDLEVAGRLDATATRSAREKIEAELAKHRVTGTSEQIAAEFDRAVAAGSAAEQLIALAVKLHTVSGARRLRYDEIYQDRLRTLDEATRAAPKNPDKWIQLSAYVLAEADNRGEKVEPRRETQRYRFQISPEQEKLRALEWAERGLALNPRHVVGLAQKALTLTALRRYDQAEKVADEALAIGGKNPDALRLYARFRSMRANQLSSEAFGLRQERSSSSTHTENRSDGVYEVTTTTTYPPTQADLNRANQLDGQAAQLRRQARSAMEAAMQVTRGTVEGALVESDLYLWDGKVAEAQAALERAIKLDPTSLEAHDQLVQFLVRAGRRDEAEEREAIARQLIHTTAAPLLRLAWTRMDQTAWQGAKGYLTRARSLDWDDARSLAFLGVVYEGNDQPALALNTYRAVLALEEARLQMDEPAVRPGPPLPRDALDFGVAIQASFHLARLHESQGRVAEALALYRRVLGYVARMKPGYESREMFTALWPDQKPERGALVLKPNNAATLVAQAYVGVGKLLLTAGQKNEANQAFRSAAMLGPLRMKGMPQIGNARGDTNYSGLAGAPAAEAQFYLARELVAQGDARGANEMLYEAGRNLPEYLRPEINELNQAIARLPWDRSSTSVNGGPTAPVDGQRARELERVKTAVRQFVPRGKIAPELVGVWEMVPDNKYLPRQQTLVIAADGSYTLTAKSNGQSRQGRLDIQTNRVSGPGRGQMNLIEDSGQISTFWFELQESDRMEFTDPEGTKYVARRR